MRTRASTKQKQNILLDSKLEKQILEIGGAQGNQGGGGGERFAKLKASGQSPISSIEDFPLKMCISDSKIRNTLNCFYFVKSQSVESLACRFRLFF